MITANKETHSVRSLCQALGEPPSTYYRSIKPPVTEASTDEAAQPRTSTSPRALSTEEREIVLKMMNSARFCDVAPAEIYATLLDEGTYHCSERTMYRILSSAGENKMRRQSAAHEYVKPELLASRPNELWSWDITKLRGPQKWTYYYLYKILDVFSRYVVGWMVAYRELALLAEALIGETCLKQKIQRDQLTVHSDNGSVMTSRTLAQLYVDLGVAKTHSRPYVSNDNPYSESAFKTLKYRPGFPACFGSIEDSREYCRQFFQWYNNEHRHSGIAMLTPESFHYETYSHILTTRSQTLQGAYIEHPERFVKGMSQIKNPPKQVWINKPTTKIEVIIQSGTVVSAPTKLIV
jgi:putative transposase